MSQIFLRYEYLIRGLYLATHLVVINLDDVYKTIITLKAPNEDEINSGSKAENCLGKVEVKVNISNSVNKQLLSLTQNKLPSGSHIINERIGFDYDKQGNIFPNHVISRKSLSPSLINFFDEVEDVLREKAQSSLKILRWRYNVPGLHKPFSVKWTEWSFDSLTWYPAPTDMHVRASTAGMLPREDKGFSSELKNLMESKTIEGLGHELFREAWEQRFNNPRSSLMIAITAIETGVKEYIATQIPDAEWLIAEIPSPPVVKIIGQYLPKVKTNSVLFPHFPKLSVSFLEKWVNKRNMLTHGKRVELLSDELEEALLYIQDLLWFIDVCQGNEWAKEYIRPNFLNS